MALATLILNKIDDVHREVYHMASLTKSVENLESRIEYLAAILDGSEAQTREAVVVTVGLVFAFLFDKLKIDINEVITHLAESADPDYEAEDHNGRLIHSLRRNLEFHRDLAAGTAKTHVPITELLAPDELAAIVARAAAAVAFERAARAEIEAPKRKKKRAKGSNVH